MNNANAEMQAAIAASYANGNANMERAFAASLAPVNGNNNMARAMAASLAPANANNNIARAMAASLAPANGNNRNRRRRNLNNTRRLRQEQNNAYERALAANTARLAMNTPPLLTNAALAAATPFNSNDQMVPGNFAALASKSVVRTNINPDNINSLASEFPSFPRALIERIIKDKKGNMNASRKNLVRRKKYGGKKNRRKTKRRN